LTAGHIEGFMQTGFSLNLILCRPGKQQLPIKPMDLGLPIAFLRLVHQPC
jgi:hypothetical protein